VNAVAQLPTLRSKKMEPDTQAASGKFPCESVMAEASAALEAESVPWLKWLSRE